MFEEFLAVLCEAGVTFDLTDSQKSIMSDTFNSFLRDAEEDGRSDGRSDAYHDGLSYGWSEGYEDGIRNA